MPQAARAAPASAAEPVPVSGKAGIPIAGSVTLRLMFREDGGLRVLCDEHPGLVLSHSNRELVWADVLPALEVFGFTPNGDN